MDIGLLSLWAAKPGESQGECYAANFNEIVCADKTGWDTVWTGGGSLGGQCFSSSPNGLGDRRPYPPDQDWNGRSPSTPEGTRRKIHGRRPGRRVHDR